MHVDRRGLERGDALADAVHRMPVTEKYTTKSKRTKSLALEVKPGPNEFTIELDPR